MSRRVHVPGSVRRQVVETKPLKRLGAEGGSPRDQPRPALDDLSIAHHAEVDRERDRRLGLVSTIERTTEQPRSVLTGRTFGAFVLLMLAALVAVAALQWATGITDDIRAARRACEVSK